MATVFRFIDNNNIAPSAVDIATRKRIRSHAATGKNAGRKVHRPSRIAALKAQKQQQHQGNIMSGSNSVWERCLTKLHDDEEDAGEVVKSTPQGKRTQPFLVDQEHSSQKMWAMLAKQYKTLHRVMGQGRAGLDFILPVPLSCRKWALSTSSVAAAQRCKLSSFVSSHRDIRSSKTKVLIIPFGRYVIFSEHQIFSRIARRHVQPCQLSLNMAEPGLL